PLCVTALLIVTSFLYLLAHLPYLLSIPTRRSSDLTYHSKRKIRKHLQSYRNTVEILSKTLTKVLDFIYLAYLRKRTRKERAQGRRQRQRHLYMNIYVNESSWN